MGFVVKNTTKCGLLDLLCPHTCRGCGVLGSVACECCKNDLLKARLRVCPLCQQVLADAEKSGATWRDDRCRDCNLPLDALFVGGWREGILAKLVKEYKYQAVRAAGEVLTEVLEQAIPADLPKNTVVVPLPTVGRHVRARGIDHTWALAKKLARRRGWKCRRMLSRAADTVQVGATADQRQRQAREAYTVPQGVNGEVNYLLLDDVWTTGASMLAATEVMRQAGAQDVTGVVIAIGKLSQETENKG